MKTAMTNELKFLFKKRQRAYQAAARYIASQSKTDPYVGSRVYSQLAQGPHMWGDEYGPFWDATLATETQSLPQGREFSDDSSEYQVEVWRNIRERSS